MHSAASSGQGAFPNIPALPIPVYSTPPPDDWIIRAYENCPEYLDRMNAWFEYVIEPLSLRTLLR